MSDVLSILPPNATQIERAIEAALRPEIDLSVITTLWDPDRCPERLLPWLAWALSVDFWDDTWPVGTRRQVIRESVMINRRKGTIGAVKRALAAAGYPDAEIFEQQNWEAFDGEFIADGSLTFVAADHWAEYRVKIQQVITAEQAQLIRSILALVAPIHCHLKVLDFSEAQFAYNGAIIADGSQTFGAA